jgi:glycosyltransferase involved in cell wall biosynthesis
MKLSVITICFNDFNGLMKTVPSVLSQTFGDFEYIIVDGLSTDGSLEFLKSQKGISRIISEKDSGIYNAMNKGICNAKGEYLLFLNSGDYLVDDNVLKNVFSTQFKEDILYGNMLIEKDGKKRLGKMPVKLSFRHMIEDTLWHPVSFIRKTLFDSIGYYDESMQIVSDYDFFLKAICVKKVSYRRLDVAISVFNLDGSSSLPENRKKLVAERKLVQEKYFSPEQLKKARTQISFRNSLTGRVLRKLGIL